MCGVQYTISSLYLEKNGKIRIVWRCRNRINHGARYCKHSPTLDKADIHRALVEAINHQPYRPEYLLAPFDQTLSGNVPAEPIPSAKSMSELYSNLLEWQKRLDIQLAELIEQYANSENWDGNEEPLTTILRKREEYDQYIDTLELKQYEEEHYQKTYPLPYHLAEYNDTISRLVFDTIKVYSDKHLLIKFKGGAEVEQELNFVYKEMPVGLSDRHFFYRPKRFPSDGDNDRLSLLNSVSGVRHAPFSHK